MGDANLFDRPSVVRNRLRSRSLNPLGSFLFQEVGSRLADRLLDVRREFPIAVDLSGQPGFAALMANAGVLDARKIATLVTSLDSPGPRGGELSVVTGPEGLPLAESSIDLAVSVMALHWINDLPGMLSQIRRALRPDGLFVAAFLGGETLHELRDCLATAEIEISGGLSPRVSPFAEIRDAGGLLQRAGFTLPVADKDRIDVTYETMFALMHDLRGMGETNALALRPRHFSSRAVFMRAAALYAQKYGRDNRIPATFEVTYLTGWAPHESQQRPLRPGSARTRLAAALDTTEQTAGEKAAPKD
ncbi:MAG: methyltransferase domain-containing protein [Alphaproteobacteria bacterium]